ncbi:MAG: hypothetical protein M3436_20400, partial [Pseudomonadota bacterium]|nr:hypothetical protein [Pseudomonadota bacterium]
MKVLLGYIIVLASVPTVHKILTFGNIDATIEAYNWRLGWSLILCIPQLVVVLMAMRYVRQMPVFFLLSVAAIAWHIAASVRKYLRVGFDPRIDFDLEPFRFLVLAAVLAVPFYAAYRILCGGQPQVTR